MQIRFRNTVVWLMIFWALVPALVVAGYLIIQINRQAIVQGEAQLIRENRQLAVEMERFLLQLQNQLIRLSEQGAVVKSASVSFLSQKAVSQMEDFRSQFPAVDAVLLFDVDQFVMEATPESVLKVDFSALEAFNSGILFGRYNLALESALPRFKFYFSPALAKESFRGGEAQYLAIGQPIIQSTDSLTEPYKIDGVLLVTINIDALAKQLTANANIDLATTNFSLNGENFTLYRSKDLSQTPVSTSKEAVEYSNLESNPALYVELKRSRSTLKKSVEASITLFAGFLVVFMASIFVLAAFVAGKLTVPLRKLQIATGSMARGNYDQIPQFSSFKEFQQLSDLLSDMGKTIQQQFTQLNSAKLNLESKVNERTKELQSSVGQLSHHEQLFRGLMQVTVDMQRAKDSDTLLDCALAELDTQFESHQSTVVLNRNAKQESSDRIHKLNEIDTAYLRQNLSAWRYQDFDFRIDQFGDKLWTLIPIRNTERAVIGQLILLGPNLSDIERDVLFIMTRLMSTILDQIALTITLERLANTDALTGLANRHFFESQFSHHMKRWNEHKTPLGLIVVDVDHLKHVNDRYGHEYGDRMIQEVSNQLKSICRGSDILARMGGDEFYILLYDADLSACEHATERLKEASKHLYLKVNEGSGFQRVPVSYSVGSACTDIDPKDALIKMADQRMYAAKHARRNSDFKSTDTLEN